MLHMSKQGKPILKNGDDWKLKALQILIQYFSVMYYRDDPSPVRESLDWTAQTWKS